MALSLGLTRPKRHAAPRGDGIDGHRSSEAIPDSLAARLRRLSADQGISTAATLLTAFAILLHRYTRGEAELAVTVNATRRLALILDDDMTLADALRQVSSALAKAFADEEIPCPLDEAGPGSTLTFEGLEPGGDDSGLTLSLRNEGGLVAELSYRRLLGNRGPVVEVGSHWRTLLEVLDESLDTIVGLLPLLAADERDRVLLQWRGDAAASAGETSGCLHHLFEATADAHPGRIALDCAGERLTYGELEARANRLAHHLRSRGIGQGSFVGLFLPRSVDVYVALLAALKAGAAYVPIDPEYPADRVAYILRDCGVAVLLTTSTLAAPLSDLDCEAVLLDREADALATVSPRRLSDVEVGPTDLAYVIYTSGSTGRPKGVQIEHRSACNLVRAESEIYRVEPTDRVYQGFSVAFDASVEEVWAAFYSGAALVVGTTEMIHSGPALAGMLTDAGVTVLSCVPTLLSMLDEDMPTVRLLILGGEQCPQDLVSRWWREDRRVVNTYGPTEATVIATFVECRPEDPVTIGKPVPSYAVYVLDSQMEPVPAGVPGELHIGGVCLARGYMNRPELTEEKFVPNPFAGDPGAPPRLYKTGDLVRFTADRSLEFLGRIDAQVKIRGFRVELAEIESQLRQCPGVQSAIVALREDTPGLQQLVAYVIPLREVSFDPSTAREQLRYRLPAYMVPSAFVTVDEFPAMPSGKIDRRRLPAPGTPADAEGASGAARTAMEGRVLEVWRRLFATPHISPDDDFFELGGHSLLAARMVSELRKDPSMRSATVLDVYDHPTLSGFAAKLEARGREEAAQVEDMPDAPDSPRKASRLTYYLCALAQIPGLYAVCGLLALGWFAAYLQWVAVYQRTGDLLVATLSLAVLPLVLAPIGLAIIVGSKWLLLGRYRAGVWPVWGFYYWRFWLAARIQALMPLNYFRGTPLLAIYARMMGAKIGSHVYLGTRYLHCFDLLSIGDDSSVGLDAHLTGYEVVDGFLRVGPITIGERCDLGARAVLGLGSTVEDDGTIDELSSLPAGTVVRSHERWIGSPARPVPHENGNGKPVDLYRASPARTFAYGLLYWFSLSVLLPIVTILGAMPTLLLFLHVVLTAGIAAALLWTPVLAALSIVLFCLEIALLKWALLGRIKPGRYTLHSGLYYRKWFVDCLMQMSLEALHPLYATIYLPPWFRMLGAKLGRRVEISTAAHVSPDLLTLGDESFIADSACLGAPKVRLGYLTVAATTIGSRTFIGNSAVLPTGAKIGDHSLIGVMSAPPSRKALADHPRSSWLGSPPVLLPRRQPSASFPDKLTFNPSWQLYLLRGFIEFWRVTLPATLLVAMGAGMIYATYLLDRTLGPLDLLLLFPALYFAAASAAVLVVVAMKWLVIGRYQPCTKPLWSSFVWRNELITAMHESFAAPALLNSLEGTPFLAPYFRLMGSRVGARVYMETTQITEFDLVDVGSDSALNLTCTLQTHLFEDRVMKASTLRLGEGCTLGPWAVVLYDTEMNDGSSLGALSLLMKGEALPARTAWQGIPARRETAGRVEATPKASFLADAANAGSTARVAELA